jgi:hypothetical protein
VTEPILEQLVAVLADSLAPRLADELAPRIADELERRASPFATVDEATAYLRCERQRVYDLALKRASHTVQGWVEGPSQQD